MKETKVILKAEREKPVEGRHPWIFSGAIDMIHDDFTAGGVVQVFSSKGQFLGKGYLSPRSEIAVRMLTPHDEPIDADFFKKRISRALELRSDWIPADTNACRLINSEGDFLPGLIVDRYGPYLAVQVLTAGMERFQPFWLEALKDALPVKGIYKKGDCGERDADDLQDSGQMIWGEECPDVVEIQECGVKFLVDIKRGQKTGFFLDQRDNRHALRRFADGKKVLNTFAYTGGFSVTCAAGGASRVVSVESSESALNTAMHNFEINGLNPKQHEFVREDVFEYLRKAEKEAYDIVILDPPAFAKSKSQVTQASRGYKDINLWAMKCVKPGGLLFTASCSSYISADLFQKILFAAAKDAKRALQMLARSSHSFDHPVSIFHPEGEYLKGLLCRVLPV